MKILISLATVFLSVLLLAGCAASTQHHNEFDRCYIADEWLEERIFTFSGQDTALERFQPAAYSNGLTLLFNENTAEIAVVGNGVEWRSNPPERFDANLPMSVSGQIHMTVFNRANVAREWNNFTESIQYGQFFHAPIENGVKVTFIMGQATFILPLPHAFTVERLTEEILPQIDSALDRIFFSRMYTLIDITRIEQTERRQELLETFPILAYQEMYILNTPLTAVERNRMVEILYEIGYTEEDLAADDEAAGMLQPEADSAHIMVSIRYTLENGRLYAEIRMDEITATEGLRVAAITPLRFFGSPGTERVGFGLVPDEAGAIIDFATPVSNALPIYREQVFGHDYARFLTDRPGAFPRLYLPAFGISGAESAFIAHIEEGAAAARIEADAPRMSGSAPFVAASFTLYDSDVLSLSGIDPGVASLRIFPQDKINHNLRVSYSFTQPGRQCFADMAVLLRAHYVDIGILTARASSQPRTVIGLTGAIDKNELILGVPVRRLQTLTTFEQATELITDFSRYIQGPMAVVFNGWMPGGIRTGTQNSARVERQLGGRRGFDNFARFLDGAGISFYPSVDVQYVYNNRLFDNFMLRRDGIVLISRVAGVRPDFNIANFHQRQQGLNAYIVNMPTALTYTRQVSDDLLSRGISGMAFNRLGEDMFSNYRRGNQLDRDAAAGMTTEALVSLSQNISLAAQGANAYVLPGVSFVYNLPLYGRIHPLFSRHVPFLQVVLSGFVDFTGPALNYTHDLHTLLLLSIETGAGVFADLFWERNEAVMGTDFNFMFTGNAALWRNDVIEITNIINNALSSVHGYSIVSHVTREDGLVIVTYENGVKIVVNHMFTDLEYQGVTVAARGYAVIN